MKEKQIHTKILDVFRCKSSKNNKTQREKLFFKVRPQKAKSQLIVSYKDLKKNFPYALIDFYECRLKLQKGKQQQNMNILTQQEQIIKNPKGKKIEIQKVDQKKQGANNKIKNAQNKQQKNKAGNYGLILDFDKILQQDQDFGRQKVFKALFSDHQHYQNHYLSDLNNDQNNIEAKKQLLMQSTYDTRRKKQKVDYRQ